MKQFFLHTLTLVLLFINSAIAQHNNSLFLMHKIPESNLLNPAVQTPCKWYIGLPVLSSIHLNYANNTFSYNQFVNSYNSSQINQAVENLHWRNYMGTEFHAQLLAIGYNGPKQSLVFTITEKNNIPITLPKQAIELAWLGNSVFEGQTAGLKGTGLYFNHYREYALSNSRPFFSGGHFGFRAKLLFGKLNISSRSVDLSLTTNENTFDLEINGDLLINSSLPIQAEVTDNELTQLELADDINLQQLLLNRKNPGFAIDLGIVYPYSDKIEISASIIDLGFIRWRSNLNSFSGSGNYIFQGALTNTIPTDDYLQQLLDELMESYELEVKQKKYSSFLPATAMAGIKYNINNNLDAGMMGRLQFYRTKAIPSLTIQGQYYPSRNVNILISYTAQYYDYKQVGLGLVIGQSPLQFYAISDNVIGAIWPLSAKSLNLRFGINLVFGCDNSKDPRKNKTSTQCYGMNRADKKPYMKNINRKYFDRKY